MNSSLPAADDATTQPRVLLVDDDEVNLLLTSIALRERGFLITEAASGERALELLRDWLPDVVVLDALMPGMDGFETCRQLRRMAAFASLPVRCHRLLRQIEPVEPARRPAALSVALIAHPT